MKRIQVQFTRPTVFINFAVVLSDTCETMVFFTDPSFKHFQDCLDAEMKRLTGMGIGSNVKEAQAFSEGEENKLWNLGLLGDSSPRDLLDTMLFLIGKNFSLRRGKEHRNLKFSQLALKPANEMEPEKLVYISFGEKNNLGWLAV